MEYPIKEGKEVFLEDLVGEHMLSGFDEGRATIKDFFDDEVEVDAVRFILDGITYEALENPDDVRSYLGTLKVTNKKITNTFPPQKVICRMKPSGRGELGEITTHETLQMIDATTNKVVAEVGTDHTDDYYPVCTMYWNPKNLAINQDK